MLSCTADGPVQTASVTLNITAKIKHSLQDVMVCVNCRNGYRVEVYIYIYIYIYVYVATYMFGYSYYLFLKQDRSGSDVEFKIPTDEYFCTAKVTYFGFFDEDVAVSHENCEFPLGNFYN